MTNWHEKYLGVPFVDGGRSFAGCDCAGLVILIYKKELDVDINDSTLSYSAGGYHNRASRAALDGLISESLAKWRSVEIKNIQPFDVVRYSIGGARCHCGVYVGQGLVLHVEQRRSASLARINLLQGYKLAEIVRHVSK